MKFNPLFIIIIIIWHTFDCQLIHLTYKSLYKEKKKYRISYDVVRENVDRLTATVLFLSSPLNSGLFACPTVVSSRAHGASKIDSSHGSRVRKPNKEQEGQNFWSIFFFFVGPFGPFWSPLGGCCGSHRVRTPFTINPRAWRRRRSSATVYSERIGRCVSSRIALLAPLVSILRRVEAPDIFKKWPAITRTMDSMSIPWETNVASREAEDKRRLAAVSLRRVQFHVVGASQQAVCTLSSCSLYLAKGQKLFSGVSYCALYADPVNADVLVSAMLETERINK